MCKVLISEASDRFNHIFFANYGYTNGTNKRIFYHFFAKKVRIFCTIHK